MADEARVDPPVRQFGGLYLRFRGVVALGLFADFVSRGHFRVNPQSATQRHGLHDAESLSGEHYWKRFGQPLRSTRVTISELSS